MLFNVDKCKVMEFNRSGKRLWTIILFPTQQEKHEATGDRAEESHQPSTDNV